jgi:hypothetical protein
MKRGENGSPSNCIKINYNPTVNLSQLLHFLQGTAFHKPILPGMPAICISRFPPSVPFFSPQALWLQFTIARPDLDLPVSHKNPHYFLN